MRGRVFAGWSLWLRWLLVPPGGRCPGRGYGVDAPSTSLERRERGIHIGPYGGAGVTDPVLVLCVLPGRSDMLSGLALGPWMWHSLPLAG